MTGHAANRLRIALLHYTAPPVVGGVERVIGRHASLMAAAGHTVRVVAGRGDSVDPRVEFDFVPLADSLHPDVAGVRESLAAGSIPPEFGRLVQRLERQLSEALAGSDVVVAHNVASLNRNLVLTASLHDLWRGGVTWRLILWHHDLAWTRARYLPELHEGRPWSLLKEQWPGAIDVTISEARRAEVARLHGADPADVYVVPGGVDVPCVRELGPLVESDPLLLAPVRITARKNIELALGVVAELRLRGRNAGLVVTGPVDPHSPFEQAYRVRLAELIGEYGIETAVVFLAERYGGSLPDEAVATLYELADALLLPSFDEGFGLPVLEAAVARLPIVCSDLPSLRALAGEAATYFDPEAPASRVATALLARLDRDPIVGLAQRARRQYAWPEVYARSIEPLLEAASAPLDLPV
jgi:glycosyltransferase involved in cell wall biosynthesis